MGRTRSAVQFPFSAMIGLEDFKLALMLNVIDPSIGGVLAVGEKGTGKTTLIRSLASILGGCPFVNLPIGATEDRLLGHVDLEKLINTKKEVVVPGLLAQADGGILYVDEVNLLPDYLASMLLDAAAYGAYYVEREGISRHFSSKFCLVGSMNLEEGDVRPQLKDRFGLSVEISAPMERDLRQQIVRQRLDFEADSAGLMSRYVATDGGLQARMQAAQACLMAVRVPDAVVRHAVELALAAHVEGMRADIVLTKAARAWAALEGQTLLTTADVDKIAPLVLRHRSVQNAPPSTPPPVPPSASDDGDMGGGFKKAGAGDGSAEHEPMEGAPQQSSSATSLPSPLQHMPLPSQATFSSPPSTVAASSKHPLLPAAMPNGIDYAHSVRQYVATDTFTLQQKRKAASQPQHHIFLLDSSGSMLQGQFIAYAKGAVGEIAALAKRSSTLFSVVALFDGGAQTALALQRSLAQVEQVILGLPTGGKTNIIAGFKAVKPLCTDMDYVHHLHVISDGKLNPGTVLGDIVLAYGLYCQHISWCHIIDTEQVLVGKKVGIAALLARHLQADYTALHGISAQKRG